MESLFVEDLEPGMRMDSSLHLGSGELVLTSYQAVDEILLEAMSRAGVTRVYLCESDGEVEELIFASGIRPAALEDFPTGHTYPWGLYSAGGRKLLSAGHALATHQLHALYAAGVGIAYEPATDTASRLARRKRALARTSVPRRGWGASRAVSLLPTTLPLSMRTSKAPPSPDGNEPKSGLSYAFLASDTEDLMNALSIGLALDVPRTIAAVRAAVNAVYQSPFSVTADALAALASGKLRDHAAASAVVAAAAMRSTGCVQDECIEPAAAALVHDLAMVWVKEELIETAGPLSDAGMRAVRRHPVRAFHTLVDADGLSPTTAILAMQTHERSNGSGYPMGLLQDETPAAARLLAAVDVLCAVLAPRPHRGRLLGREAMELCVKLAGEGALDGAAARALLRSIGLYPVGSRVMLSTGEVAVVLAASGDSFERPVVQVIVTTSGCRPPSPRIMDLSELPGISIDREIDPEST
jgi:HD-GYP domain-containing protein (c-di-GMP phosphodiesterase class II)